MLSELQQAGGSSSQAVSGCCRDKILVKWFEDCTQTVDLRQLLGE